MVNRIVDGRDSDACRPTAEEDPFSLSCGRVSHVAASRQQIERDYEHAVRTKAWGVRDRALKSMPMVVMKEAVNWSSA